MLPTPVAWDGNGGGARKPKDGKANALGYSLTLKDRAAAQMLPTPTRFDYNSARTPEKWEEDKAKYAAKGINLHNPLKQHARLGMLPTPSATSDPKGGATRTDPKRQRDTLAYAMHDPERGKTSHLSPLFVEEMMGFPKGWTASPFQSGDESQ